MPQVRCPYCGTNFEMSADASRSGGRANATRGVKDAVNQTKKLGPLGIVLTPAALIGGAFSGAISGAMGARYDTCPNCGNAVQL